MCCRVIFFFFQAEDGIRDLIVTGVQTCALPIYTVRVVGQRDRPERNDATPDISGSERPVDNSAVPANQQGDIAAMRSEEQRLNSSHDQISYAVFCLKKKKKNKRKRRRVNVVNHI